MDIVELLKTIGSISGILAAGFLIRDRYVKHFPLAIIVARPLMHGSINIQPFLFVKNVSDRPILVSWENPRDQNQLRIASTTYRRLTRPL
jgi:hypothetical protein